VTPLGAEGTTSRSLDPERFFALARDRTERERTQTFVAEGTRFVHSALAHGFPVLGLLHTPELLSDPSGQKLVRVLKRSGVPACRASVDEFRTLSLLDEPQGIAVIVPMRWGSIHAPFRPARSLWLGLDEIRSAGNLGTMLRTACAAGATGAALLGNAVDPFDPRCVRATMGAVFGLRLARVDDRDVTAWQRRTGGRVVGADGAVSSPCGLRPHGRLRSAKSPSDYRRISYRAPILLMLGCERRGLSPRQRALCDALVSIPMREGIDSLNVAAAAAVLLYEAHRQREP